MFRPTSLYCIDVYKMDQEAFIKSVLGNNGLVFSYLFSKLGQLPFHFTPSINIWTLLHVTLALQYLKQIYHVPEHQQLFKHMYCQIFTAMGLTQKHLKPHCPPC